MEFPIYDLRFLIISVNQVDIGRQELKVQFLSETIIIQIYLHIYRSNFSIQKHKQMTVEFLEAD